MEFEFEAGTNRPGPGPIEEWANNVFRRQATETGNAPPSAGSGVGKSVGKSRIIENNQAKSLGARQLKAASVSPASIDAMQIMRKAKNLPVERYDAF